MTKNADRSLNKCLSSLHVTYVSVRVCMCVCVCVL